VVPQGGPGSGFPLDGVPRSWAPRSGQWASFPEVDRAEFFTLNAAREKMNPAQGEFLDRLAAVDGRDAR
jgi:predicted NUDIX family NTP pyrophosphohydrolase